MLYHVTNQQNAKQHIVDVSEGLGATPSVNVEIVNVYAGGVYAVLVNSKLTTLVVESDGMHAITVWMNGYAYEFDVFANRHATLLQILSSSPAAKSRSVKLSAPMPGLLKSIHTSDGAVVRRGDVLFTLEAMKMENAIKAPSSGRVSHCIVQSGTAVEKGAVLCTIEPTT